MRANRQFFGFLLALTTLGSAGCISPHEGISPPKLFSSDAPVIHEAGRDAFLDSPSVSLVSAAYDFTSSPSDKSDDDPLSNAKNAAENQKDLEKSRSEVAIETIHGTNKSNDERSPANVAGGENQEMIGSMSESAVTNDVDDSAMTLEEIESLALANNPTLRGLAATTQKAAGYRTQVSLRANPTVGYQGVQLADQGTDQHTAFVEQEFVTGDKLALNRRVLGEAVQAQLLELDAQRLRIRTDVRAKFFEALAAQQRIEVIGQFQVVANKALEIAELRKEALEGTQIDVLQAKVQKNEVDLAYQQSQIVYSTAWKELAALSGVTSLFPTRLSGSLPTTEQILDWDSVAASILNDSPELKAAQTRVRQSLAFLERQGVQAIPNLTMQMAAGVDNATNSGLINVQLAAPIPVFNKNQGNIAAARADYCRAMMEVERIENSIAARLASVSQSYQSAAAAVDKYSLEILPSATESMSLAEVAYKAGETNFIQVLVARRTYFDSNLQYIAAQSQLAQARARIDGLVLSGGLDPINDQSGDDSLRGLTFSQQ